MGGQGESGQEPVVPLWKRTLDVSCIVVSLPILIPLMALVALAIKIRSAGPIFIRQERMGFMGRRFMCWKFRTMSNGTDTSVHERYARELVRKRNVPMTKKDLTGDPRIIPWGRLLRATGVDELPQLINVFFGEMSLVGPRPCMDYEFEEYEPWQRERCHTLPGLTGLWQVSGKNHTTFSEMMRLDIDYVRNKSLWLDLKILLKTVPTILGQVFELLTREKAVPPTGVDGEALTGQQGVRIAAQMAEHLSAKT